MKVVNGIAVERLCTETHLGAGVVRAVGAGVEDLAEGDHVILSYNYCNSCHSCRTSRPYHCSEIYARNFGGKRSNGSSTIISEPEFVSTCFFGQSSFCNPTIAQAASCVKIDKALPLDIMCAMGCGFQTGAGSIYNIIKPQAREVRFLAVFGMGGVGSAAMMAARNIANQNPGTLEALVAVDIDDSRLALAQELGATHSINSTKVDLEKVLAEITNGHGLDAAVDCTGIVPVINSMIDMVGAGGLTVTVGAPAPGSTASVDIFNMLIQCKTYVGCHQGNSYAKEVRLLLSIFPKILANLYHEKFIPFLAKEYSKGNLPLDKLQRTYPIENINIACEDMLKGSTIKPVLL